MSTSAISTDAVSEVVAGDLEQTRRSVAALGDAIHAVQLPTSPAVARAVQAQQNLYDVIETEFGLLTSAEVGKRLGTRAQRAPRNRAIAAHNDGRLLALHRSNRLLYPGFQFDRNGDIRQVIARVRQLADKYSWDETSVIEWLVAPTTYLGGRRPVDVIDQEGRLLATAENAFGMSW